LKNDQNFYLIFGRRSWVAQVEGKKYYLLNLPEEERAAQSIANLLRYGIKSEEGDPRHPGEPVLKAYKLGDGKITVGWGHAESVRKSKFKVGQKITTSDADELLKMDLTNASDGVRKIFREWEEKGLDVKINQDMFDALVSISFNTGIGGLRKSMMIQDIKKGKFEEAGEKIKTLNVSKKFPGLQDRREKESEMFLASL
jgi:lysozyme